MSAPTEEQITALADAMWQLLDDMVRSGQDVCLASKAQARIAYEPFLDKDDPADLDWMTLAEAEAIMDELNR